MSASMEMDIDDPYAFDDYFPSMIESAGYEGLMKEICNGFCMLMDVAKGLITFESLKRSAFNLGLNELGDEEILYMLAEGDMDGDGALNQMEFCILMLRLNSTSTSTYDGSNMWMDDMDMGMDGISMPAL